MATLMSAIRKIVREARALRLQVFGFGLGMLLLLALAFAEPLSSWWSSMRHAHHLTQAEEAIARQDWMTALEAVQNAARSEPQSPEMLRTSVRVLAGMNVHPDEILRTLQQVENAGGMTPEMGIIRAQAHLTRGDLLAAQQALNALPEATRQNWDAIELEATLLLHQGRQHEAQDRLQATEDATTATPDGGFRRAVLGLSLPSASERRAARARVWQEARAGTPHTPLALTLLCQDAGLTADEATELLRLIGQRPPTPATAGLHYTALTAALRLGPTRKASLLRTEATRAAALPSEAQIGYLMFLSKNREPQAMLTFLKEHGTALKQLSPGDDANMELEALGKSQQWAAVRQKLARPESKRLGALTFNLWQACAITALDPGSSAALDHLQLAYAATGKGRDITGALRVADVAANMSHHAFAAARYQELAEQPMLPSDMIACLEKACHCLTQAKDTAALLRVTRTLADRSPARFDHAYRADYLDLLTGGPFETIVPDIHRPDASFQARQRLLSSMIYHRLKQLDPLRTELQDLERATNWSAGERAVIAGLLAAAGEPARAWQVAEKVPESLLLAEEAAMLELARK